MKIAKIALVHLAIALTIGLIVGLAVSGAIWIPIAVAGGTLLFTIAINAIISNFFNITHPHRYKTTLHPEIIRHNEQEGPKLGELVKTDVHVINDTTQSFLFKMELLRCAKQSIDITFNFAGGEHFTQVLDLIEEKMKSIPNFRTHFIISRDLLEDDQINRMNEMKERFGNRFYFLVTDRHFLTNGFLRTEENHAKALVVDDKYFVVGGSGIHEKMDREVNPTKENKEQTLADSLIDQTFKDTDIIGCGELAKTIRGQIYNLYQIWARRMKHDLKNGEGMFFPLDPNNLGVCEVFHEKEGLIEDAPMSFLVGGPEHRAENPISKAITEQIDRAQNDIQIANLYLNPAKEVSEALRRAKKRKVDIIGHFNGMGKGISVVHYNYLLTNQTNYSLLTQAYEHKIPDQLYHKKVTTFDDKVAVVGSVNLGQKSRWCDTETAVVIKDGRVVKALKDAIKEDEKQSKLIIDRDTIDKRKFLTMILSPLYTTLGRIVG